MLAKDIVDTFLAALTKNLEAYDCYGSNALWTAVATGALVEAGQCAAKGTEKATEVRAAARRFRDADYGRSEYLTLDVCVYDNATWGPPLFIAEHENSKDVQKVQYCAWKLLSTESERRVLVAYYTPEVGFRALVDEVQTVAKAFADRGVPRDLLLIAAPWAAEPTSNEALVKLFESRIVGAS